MALSTKAAVLAKRQAMNYQFKKPHARRLVQVLFEVLAQHKGNPDLEIKPFTFLADADTILADVACKVYGIVLTKDTATAAFFKASDHNTTASETAPEVEVELNAIGEEVLAFPDGYAQGTGFTVKSNTTSDGGTGSTAGDGPRGFAILGGA